jgi:hypothetical protein
LENLPTKARKKALQITKSCVLFSRTLLQQVSDFGYKGILGYTYDIDIIGKSQIAVWEAFSAGKSSKQSRIEDQRKQDKKHDC